MKNSSNSENYRLEDVFPGANEPGSALPGINIRQLRQMAAAVSPIREARLNKMIEAHHLFLNSGGAGGHWQTLLINGLVVGLYTGAEGEAGEQANFEHRRLAAGLAEKVLPFANFCGLFAEQLNARAADLGYCLFSDTWLPDACFDQSRLCQTDFSRACLSGASFVGADLRRADFENCDLRNANFTAARLAGARFPGANLEGVVY